MEIAAGPVFHLPGSCANGAGERSKSMTTTYDLKDRVAVITGGGQGIGRAIAERMIASGARVALWDRDADLAVRTADEIGPGGIARAYPVDVSDPHGVETARDRTLAAFGTIDILVNNAGITGPNTTVWDYPVEEWRRVFAVNVDGPFLTCRAVLPHMIARDYGRVVNIASVAGKEGNPNASAYSASKAAVIALTKSLGKETAGRNISVNAITPAVAKTAIFDQMTQEHISFMLSKIPRGAFVPIEEIAGLACYAASQECRFTTGAVFDITGGRSTY
jgi:3-oxoacyl-[acyl-carrier protein] reductase